MDHLLQGKQFVIFNPEQSLFSVVMVPEWNFVPRQKENFIWNENWNELVQELPVRKGNEYYVNKYREIYEDGMNSFQNESHSGIMWIIVNSVLYLPDEPKGNVGSG